MVLCDIPLSLIGAPSLVGSCFMLHTYCRNHSCPRAWWSLFSELIGSTIGSMLMMKVQYCTDHACSFCICTCKSNNQCGSSSSSADLVLVHTKASNYLTLHSKSFSRTLSMLYKVKYLPLCILNLLVKA